MIYLVQTDTTAGFCSQDLREINLAKGRSENQPCLITLSKFITLKKFARVPPKFRNLARRAKKTTLIYPNKKAIRVVKSGDYAKFLDEIGWCYSSSANPHGVEFDMEFARSKADIILGANFISQKPSRILKLSRNSIKKVR